MAKVSTSEGIVIQVIEVGPTIFKWAMRKGDDKPFMHSTGVFAKAKHAETNARHVIMRANKVVAFVETVSEPLEQT